MADNEHQHHHHHHQAHGHGLSETNSNWFEFTLKSHLNHLSSTEQAIHMFDSEWVQALSKQISKAMISRLDWLGIQSLPHQESIRMLDYACGRGLISETLYPHVDEIRGIDISKGMITTYNERTLRLPNASHQRIHAVKGDLTATECPAIAGPDYHNFDLAIMCMALHHVSDPLVMLQALVQRLKPGGRVVVIDWSVADNGSDEVVPQYSAQSPIAHSGFSERQVLRMFEEAGCEDCEYQVNDEASFVPPAEDQWPFMFFARGVKALG